jgi:hypothetical protein
VPDCILKVSGSAVAVLAIRINQRGEIDLAVVETCPILKKKFERGAPMHKRLRCPSNGSSRARSDSSSGRCLSNWLILSAIGIPARWRHPDLGLLAARYLSTWECQTGIAVVPRLVKTNISLETSGSMTIFGTIHRSSSINPELAEATIVCVYLLL